VFFNAENAEGAENGKDRGTANDMFCEPTADLSAIARRATAEAVGDVLPH